MIRFHKFRQDLFDPMPARDVYVQRGPGRGWPEECPPVRAANGFGFDLLANFDVTFVRQRNGSWRADPDIVITSDFDYAASEDAPPRPLTQQYAWFWQKGQTIPHVISDNVFRHIRNQVKISSFLFIRTDANELLLLTDVPNLRRPYRAVSALVETDWYPASYPWHMVIELDPREKRVRLRKGDPVCRIVPVRRDNYFAQPMSTDEFDEFFQRGQKWLTAHGRVPEEQDAKNGGTLDITRTYVRQQLRSRFVVIQ